MQSVLLAGLSASNECRKIVVELILVSGHQPGARASPTCAIGGQFQVFCERRCESDQLVSIDKGLRGKHRMSGQLGGKFAFALRERCG